MSNVKQVLCLICLSLTVLWTNRSCSINIYCIKIDEIKLNLTGLYCTALYYSALRCHHPYGRKWRRTKEPLDESENGEWKGWLKLNIQKTKIMASSPITSWQIDAETVETVADFIFLGSKITADGDCSHEIKRYLLLGRKAMTNLDSKLKSKDISLPTKVHLVKAIVFPVVMYGCGS